MKVLSALATFMLLLKTVTAVVDYADNIFVILSGSKFYFNYRHTLNAI